MKKVLLMLIVMLSVLSAKTKLSEAYMTKWVAKVTTAKQPYSFTFYTTWRTHFSVNNMKDEGAYKDVSRVDWYFNLDDKNNMIGYFIDETETITSFYKLDDVKWYMADADNSMVITGRATSNVGNVYHFIINHYNKSFIIIGQMDGIVIRRYYIK